MPNSFLDGQQNLAALSVPGLYTDIILPTPLLLGTPTNIEGLVGVGSWGPVGALIPATEVSDAALSIGYPQIRTYDIASHIAAATQVGGAIGFYCVRVTDGTDTAASAAILDAAAGTGVTITGKYTGSLGNGIQVSIQNGTLANSYLAVVAFPGMPPEQINNIPSGAKNATGSVLFTANPLTTTTITIGGTSVEFITSGATGSEINIGATLPATLAQLALFLNASSDTNIKKCYYSVSGTTLNVTYKTPGTSGNSFTLATTVAGATVSAATLAGGAAQGNGFWVSLAAAINAGNVYHGPSNYVVATAGSGTGAPVLASPVQLTGGTDGASGVTDSTLMGQDVMPRKGMYALRSSGIDCFTLVDHSTIADWSAIGSFGLSEDCLPIVSEASGTSYAQTIADRINSGSDTPWMWILTGDWPSFYDSYNGVTRLINPTAFAIGINGNLSPQQSPLNKPLPGVSATETSTLGQTYGDTDLSLINQGGVDTILPPQNSPGGYYFSFATGRNASSNTAARGIEYTRMTNFLVKTAQQKAAGSFVGQLQSIQPNDQTRANAKALFDGFSAQLASPQTGLGINGQGMIDGWATQCNLANNPPNSQAAGYLFLYWQVRYLNVIRYFVIKFQGGGNVTVTVQNTAPAGSTFPPTT
jgi:hypothetical protein